MAQIARLIGGAGTGKTSELLRIMEKCIEAGDIGPEQIGFASFTRAARAEAASRAADKFNVERSALERHGYFRTIHSVCYRALNVGKELLTDDRASRAWLRDALQDDVEIDHDAEATDLADVAFQGASETARALALWDTARNRLISLKDLTLTRQVRARENGELNLERLYTTVERYEQAKRLDHRVDFSDILGRFAGVQFWPDHPPTETEPDGFVPALPVWFFDEQQDASALLDKVCHRLIATPQCEWVYVVGDPFQAIYGWAGADHRCFRAWPAVKERIMPKSYRCPREVLDLGEATLRDCSDYFDRGIAPADHAGSVEASWNLRSLIREIDPRDEWLVLARSNFFAGQLAKLLEREGIPWSPTRGRGGWNAPVKIGGLLALRHLQTGAPIDGGQWRSIIKLLPSKLGSDELLVRGTKARFDDDAQVEDVLWATLAELGGLGGTEKLREFIASGRWSQVVDGGSQLADAVERWGEEAVREPKVKVGTIHSCKGAESDNVLLLTTTSAPVNRSQEDQAGFDEERRVEYVGVTRARRRLVIAHERRASYRMKLSA